MARSFPHILAVFVVVVVVVSLATTATSAGAERIDVVRDTWVSAYPGEESLNTGSRDVLKTKGVQEFSLLDIDARALRGRTIKNVRLFMHARSPDRQIRVTVSSVATAWTETQATFLKPRLGEAGWTAAGGDLTEATLGEGNTVWSSHAAGPANPSGYQQVDVSPAVFAARLAGLSEGFVLFDDIGSEWSKNGDRLDYRVFPNRFLSSREAGRHRAPYFEVVFGPSDQLPPEAPASLAADESDLPAGELWLTWITPRDHGAAGVLGFDVRVAAGDSPDERSFVRAPREQIPLPRKADAWGKAGERNVMRIQLRDMPGSLAASDMLTFAVRAVDAAGNVGPSATHVWRRPVDGSASVEWPATSSGAGDAAAGDHVDDGGTPVATNGARDATPGSATLGSATFAIVDPFDVIDPNSGRFIADDPPDDYLAKNHLWRADTQTIQLHGARGEYVAFQVVVVDASKTPAVKAEFSKGPVVSVYRPAYVKAGNQFVADPLVRTRSVERDKAAFVGLNAVGRRRAQVWWIEVFIPANLKPGSHVGELTITDADRTARCSIHLNVWNFALPNRLSFIPQMNAYSLPADNAMAYYRLAHEHRTTLNRLPYNWRGRPADEWRPDVRDDGSLDWQSFDRRWSGLFTGEAFADLSRGEQPIEAFYLPLNENWPVPIDPHYRGGYWPSEAIDHAYRDQFVDASRQIAEHVRGRNWRDTTFEFYLTNKVYHRRDDWSRTSAYWVFDEPANYQDVEALRWYAAAFHEGIGDRRRLPDGRLNIGFRADVSRPQWQRDALDGLLDVNVVGAAFFRYNRLIRERQRRWPQVVYQYGSANKPGTSNLQPILWQLDVWSRGGDGVLPWQTIGNETSWHTADELSLFYPPRKGMASVTPSVRLKAFRRGQQDVEYLQLLVAATGQPRYRVEQFLRQRLALDADVQQRGEDAGSASYPRVRASDLAKLRRDIGAFLDQHAHRYAEDHAGNPWPAAPDVRDAIHRSTASQRQKIDP